MFLPFFIQLKAAKLPVTLREYLTMLEALDADLVTYDVEGFYYLSRSALVKDERHLDRFDRVFARILQGRGGGFRRGRGRRHPRPARGLAAQARREAPERRGKAARRSAGRLRQADGDAARAAGEAGKAPSGRLEDGSAPPAPRPSAPMATTPRACASARTKAATGARSRSGTSASSAISTTASSSAPATSRWRCKRLRRWVREGAAEELDLPGTIRATAEHGWLDVKTRPERRNAVKVLLFLDVGGSMDDHVKIVEELFSAARSRVQASGALLFPQLPLRGRVAGQPPRATAQMPDGGGAAHLSVRTTRCIFVGDAAMSPCEIVQPGGSVEHWNAEPGEVWLQARAGALQAQHLAQPSCRAGLALHAVHADDPADHGRAHVCAHAWRPRRGHEGTLTLICSGPSRRPPAFPSSGG